MLEGCTCRQAHHARRVSTIFSHRHEGTCGAGTLSGGDECRIKWHSGAKAAMHHPPQPPPLVPDTAPKNLGPGQALPLRSSPLFPICALRPPSHTHSHPHLTRTRIAGIPHTPQTGTLTALRAQQHANARRVGRGSVRRVLPAAWHRAPHCRVLLAAVHAAVLIRLAKVHRRAHALCALPHFLASLAHPAPFSICARRTHVLSPRCCPGPHRVPSRALIGHSFC